VVEVLIDSGTWVDEEAWDMEFWDEELAEDTREEIRLYRAERRRANKEFAMGPHYWNADRPIHYYRRVRRCSNCAHVYATAEVAEDLLNEVDELRDLKGEVESQAARAASAVNKIRRMLKA
jgi:hypothetical protein